LEGLVHKQDSLFECKSYTTNLFTCQQVLLNDPLTLWREGGGM
jgi:hypothetical protein